MQLQRQNLSNIQRERKILIKEHKERTNFSSSTNRITSENQNALIIHPLKRHFFRTFKEKERKRKRKTSKTPSCEEMKWLKNEKEKKKRMRASTMEVGEGVLGFMRGEIRQRELRADHFIPPASELQCLSPSLSKINGMYVRERERGKW